jgi:hypothetical protein|tara:strand:- start:161 stop:352 length:192 start_codon:yes stop_codon:yes gene_type:complete
MLLLELHYLQPLKLVGLVVGPVGLVVVLVELVELYWNKVKDFATMHKFPSTKLGVLRWYILGK